MKSNAELRIFVRVSSDLVIVSVGWGCTRNGDDIFLYDIMSNDN